MGLPGYLVEQLGVLTFLVQLDKGQFWKRHSNQLRYLEEMPSDETVTVSAPIVTNTDIAADNSDSSPNSGLTESSPVLSNTAPQIRSNQNDNIPTPLVRRNPPRMKQMLKRYEN